MAKKKMETVIMENRMEKMMRNQVEILEYATRESLMLGREGGAGSVLGREENCYDKKVL